MSYDSHWLMLSVFFFFFFGPQLSFESFTLSTSLGSKLAKVWEVNGPGCIYLSRLFNSTEAKNACKEVLNIFNGLTGTVYLIHWLTFQMPWECGGSVADIPQDYTGLCECVGVYWVFSLCTEWVTDAVLFCSRFCPGINFVVCGLPFPASAHGVLCSVSALLQQLLHVCVWYLVHLLCIVLSLSLE